jgi:hypothetical protein
MRRAKLLLAASTLMVTMMASEFPRIRLSGNLVNRGNPVPSFLAAGQWQNIVHMHYVQTDYSRYPQESASSEG